MKVTIYGTDWCGDCRRTRSFLDEHGIAYDAINVDRDHDAEAELISRVGKRAVPQLVIDGEWWQPYTPDQGLLYDELYQRLHIQR